MERSASRKKICWPVFSYIVGYHIFLAIALPIYFLSHTPSASLIGWTVALVFLSGLAITSGYHRLYSHSTYKAHPAVEAVFLFFATLATQGSALRWCNDHRLHHAFVDTEKDPYSVKKGLFHAHMLWMFFRSEPIDPKVVSDLTRSKLLVFQDKYYAWCMVAVNALTFLAVGWMLGDYLGAFLFVWWVRLFCLHHTTWCINSLAHYWGTKNYSQEHSAMDNYLISLLTYGEGYHNYHHTFSHDYRNGIRWYHFDPAKWLIWILSKCGLASHLKRVNNDRIVKQLLFHHRDQILEKMKISFHHQKDLYREGLKNRELSKEAPQILRPERAVFVSDKGPSEDAQSGVKPTPRGPRRRIVFGGGAPDKTDFSITSGIMAAKITEICDHLTEQLARKQELIERYKRGQKELLAEIREVKKKIKRQWKEWRAAIKLISKSIPLES